MVRYSKNLIKPSVSDRLTIILSALLARRKISELKLVFELLFTKAERTMLLKRIGIQYMLLKNNERLFICDMLKVSSSTVAYYALQLESQKPELTFLLKSILLSEKFKGTLEDIIADFLIQPSLYRSHKGIKARYERDKEFKKHL